MRINEDLRLGLSVRVKTAAFPAVTLSVFLSVDVI